MNLTVLARKGPKRSLVVALAQYYVRLFKLERSSYNLTIGLEKLSAVQPDGLVEQAAAIHVGKEIFLRFDSKLGKFDLLKAFGHEMVHVKQIARGQLKMVPTRTTYKLLWLGKPVKNNLPYLSRPWEIEALSKEVLLLRRQVEHFQGARS